MKKLKFEIDINASQKKVWETMLNLDTYRKWVQVSWPDSSFEGNWKQGEDIRFIGPDGSGTLANLSEVKPYESIKAKHIAILLKDGQEDRESDVAKGWVGIRENYTFVKNGNGTHLVVDIETQPDWEAMFNDGWPDALAELKRLSEQ